MQDIYQNELDKACFHDDKAYGGFKDLCRKAAPNKVLCVYLGKSKI